MWDRVYGKSPNDKHSKDLKNPKKFQRLKKYLFIKRRQWDVHETSYQ